MIDSAPTQPGKSMVPDYTLPPLLEHADGSPVQASTWPGRRRELLHLFSEQVFGWAPEVQWSLTAQLDRAALRHGMQLREIAADIHGPRHTLRFHILIHQPQGPGPWPLLLGLNFAGNHSTTPDPWVSLAAGWTPAREDANLPAGPASDLQRGCLARRWPVAQACLRGYAVATVYSGDFDEDRDDHFVGGVHGCLQTPADRNSASWGTIAAWAWGLSRAREAIILAGEDIDPARIGLIGHSRMGKAALWAAAQDEGFAWCMANNSGCTGAAIARRCQGERLLQINSTFPHWFCHNYHHYNEREHSLPIDQHQLLALIAPRHLHIASADEDAWADPQGEFAGCVAADPAWQLLGAKGLNGMHHYPPSNQALGHSLSYHHRPGYHDLSAVDWHHLLDRLGQRTNESPGSG